VELGTAAASAISSSQFGYFNPDSITINPVDQKDAGALSPRNTGITYRFWLTQPVLLQK